MEHAVIPNRNAYEENFEDFFEQSLCGFIIENTNGFISRANKKVADWLNNSTAELEGKKFSDLLSIGSKVYFETHLRPLLRLQGFFDEVVLELSDIAGNKLRVMVNGLERRDDTGDPYFIRYTILKATDRLQYEQNLQNAKAITEKELAKQTEIVALRDQLIAVLGHDLRNPLSAITLAVDLLHTLPWTDSQALLAILKRSSTRMLELVTNIMDFARTRMGAAMLLTRQTILLDPVLQQVVAELRLIYPRVQINTFFNISQPVNCDSSRVAQLLSNLLGNALTHGAPDAPIIIHAFQQNSMVEISVINTGAIIPSHLHDKLFAPFTREAGRLNHHGLGLGLYICSEIAKAHKGSLSFISTTEETSFTFRMPV